MCALAHYLERDGFRTALIGYIPEHVARMRPPRALVVPFELGRPLGAPSAPDFQRRVLGTLVALFDAPSGPVLVKFPDPAPAAPADHSGWACPVQLAPAPAAGSSLDRLRDALAAEIELLAPWHAEAVRARGRTTVGISGIAVDAIPKLMMDFAADPALPSTQPGVSMPVLVKRATDDLKAFYYEAATAKPGHIGDVALADWLWGETAAGRAMLALREVCLGSEVPAVKALGQMQILPNHQRDKRK